MAIKVITQNKFLRGLNAASSAFAQPAGIVKRLSNMVFTRRGALRTCDGSSMVSSLNGGGAATAGISWAIGNLPAAAGSLGYPQPLPSFVMLQNDPNYPLASPTGVSVSDGGTGGNLSAGTYLWVVTALDVNGETLASASATLALGASGHKATVSWTAVTNAAAYNVYRTVANGSAGTELLSGQSASSPYTDNVADGSLTVSPPSSNTTQQMLLLTINSSSYTKPGSIAAYLPSTLATPARMSAQAIGGYGGPASVSATINPSGGLVGISDQIPQIVPFVGDVIIALSNGVAPRQYDGTTCQALVNNFSASWPAWAATTAFALGSVIAVSVSGTPYTFTASQGGTTGGSAPTWSATLGAQIPDGSVIWQNTGVAAATAPRAAAHALVYAGSLWLWNTWPTNTSDGLDGPSCLKMSNANDPNSWNPLNTAFVNKSDGTQGMGMATFTVAEAGIAPQGTLVLFKDFSTYEVSGVFGASNFSIQQAQTDMGCVAPRTILFVPGFGIMRLTHLGVAVYDGVRDRIISEEIRPYLFPDPDSSDVVSLDWNYAHLSQSFQVANPPMYCMAFPLNQSPYGSLTRIACYDLVLKVWTIIDLPQNQTGAFSVSTGTQVRAEGTIPITAVCGGSDGTIRTLFGGAAKWGQIANSVSYSFQTPEVFADGGATRLYFRRLKIRGTYLDTPSLTVTPYYQGLAASASNAGLFSGSSQGFGAQAFEIIAPLATVAMNASAVIAGTGRIQIEAVDWEVEPKQSGMGSPTIVSAPASV